jgi:hypothetical protein
MRRSEWSTDCTHPFPSFVPKPASAITSRPSLGDWGSRVRIPPLRPNHSNKIKGFRKSPLQANAHGNRTKCGKQPGTGAKNPGKSPGVILSVRESFASRVKYRPLPPRDPENGNPGAVGTATGAEVQNNLEQTNQNYRKSKSNVQCRTLAAGGRQ